MEYEFWTRFSLTGMIDVLNCDTRGHELTVMKLEDKRFYAVVFSVHDGPREYDRYAPKAGGNGRGRRHVPINLKQRDVQSSKLSCLTWLLSLMVCEGQSTHQEVTSPLFPSVKHLAHVQVL